MTKENTPSESQFLLIEQSLRGELSPEAAAELETALRDYPELERFHDEALRQQTLLSRNDRRGSDQVDWKKRGRSARRLAWRYTLGLVACVAFTLFCLWTFIETEGYRRYIILAIALLYGTKVVDRWNDRQSFADRCRALPDETQDFVRNYRKLLKKEWKRWRYTWVGDVLGGLFVGFLGMVGKYPEICFTIAGGCFALAFYHRNIVELPLRRELEALKKS